MPANLIPQPVSFTIFILLCRLQFRYSMLIQFNLFKKKKTNTTKHPKKQQKTHPQTNPNKQKTKTTV